MQIQTTNANEISLEKIFSCTDIDMLNDPEIFNQFAAFINKLILTNFESLIQLLYRIDVSEMKIKAMLKESPKEDAGHLIAHLIIERQLQKLKYKMAHAENDTEIAEDEKW
jgi:hypothetical protein